MNNHKIYKKNLSFILIFAMCFVTLFSGFNPVVAHANEIHNLSQDDEQICEQYRINKAFDGEIIIKYKPGTVKKHSALNNLFKSKSNTYKEIQPMLYKLKKGESVAEAIKRFSNDGEIEYIEPNIKYRICKNALSSEETSNQSVSSAVYHQITINKTSEDVTVSERVYIDKYFDQQWALKDIQAEKTWQQLGKVKGCAVVAVLDTGVDYMHPDLEGRIIQGENFVKEKKNGSKYPIDYGIMDDNGHGTFASGIISALYNNGLGIAGLAGELDVKVLAVKVMNDDGEGDVFEISEGIRYAADEGADIISLSLGGKGYSQTMANAVKYAQDKGILVVAAAGNDGEDGSDFYPAAYPGVLTVGAIGVDDSIADFSNFGEVLDIMAPGVQIYSTSIESEAEFGNEKDGYYAKFNGTSFSCPYAAGVAGVYKLTHPKSTPEEIKEVLIQSAYDLEDVGWDEKSGYGKLNMYTTLDQNGGVGRYIKIQNLKRNDYLRDEVTLTASVLRDYDEINKVVFYLDKVSKKNIISEIKNPKVNRYTSKWDTTTQKNGTYQLIAVAYKDNVKKGEDIIPIKIVNEVTNGMLLEVKDPDGNPAINSHVNVYIKDTEHEEYDYDRIFTGRTNHLGIVRIPGTLGQDLSSVHVIIQGGFDYKDMPKGTSLFIYNKTLTGPGKFTITGKNTQPVQFKTLDKTELEITDVAYYATAVDKNGVNIGTTNELNNNKQKSPIIFIDQGSYDFFSYSNINGDTYFLTKWAKDIKKHQEKMTMIFDGQKTGQINLITNNENKVKAGMVYLYNEKTNASLGIKLGGENVYVSSDTYRYKVDAEVEDLNGGQNWIYTFDSGKKGIEIPENKTVNISAGGKINIANFDLSYEAVEDHVLEANKIYNKDKIKIFKEDGTTIVKFPIGYELFQTLNRFADSYGNFVCKISRGSLGKNGIMKKEDMSKIQSEDVLQPRFRVINKQTGNYEYPMYWEYFKDTPDYSPDGEKSSTFFEFAFWDIMSLDGKVGDYELQLSLDKNPLTDGNLAKKLIARLYDDNLHKIITYDENCITTHVNPDTHLTVPYIYIYSLKDDIDAISSASLKQNNPMEDGEVDATSSASINTSKEHWEQVYGAWGNKYQNEGYFGTVALDSTIKLSKKENGNLAVFRYTLGDDRYLYLFRPFTNLEDLDKEIHLKDIKIRQVDLNDLKSNGKTVDHISKGNNLIYRLENHKNLPIRMPIFKNHVWVEEGTYSLDGQYISHADDNGDYTNYYVVEKDVNVNEDKNITFDISKTAKLVLKPTTDGFKKWKGAALLPYSDYNQTFKIEESQGSIFYIPTDIDYNSINIVLGLSDPEKPSYIWNYLFQKEGSTNLEAGKSYELQVGGNLKPVIELEKNTYKSTENINGYSAVLDEYNNRLLSTRISPDHEWFDVDKRNSNTKTTLYSLSNKGIFTATYDKKSDYIIQHEQKDNANLVYPYIRLYKKESNGNEQLLYNESKPRYYHNFDESLISLGNGQYRVELAYAGNPNGSTFTGKDKGLFTINNSSSSGGNSSGSSGGGSPNNKSIPNEKNIDLLKETKAKEIGDKTVISIEEKKLQDLKNNKNLEKVILNMSNKKDIEIKLAGNALKDLVKSNTVITFDIQSQSAGYQLPASAINFDEIEKQLGSNVENLSVNISTIDAKTEKEMNEIFPNAHVKSLSKPINFTIEVKGENGKTITVHDFGKNYVKRTILLDYNAIDKNKATGVRYNPITKEYSFVPTIFKEVDGKLVATLKSPSNSFYIVVKSSKTFDDVQNHWAKREIETLASKFIINGVSENHFDPDKNITRAEFITLLVKSLGLNTHKNTVQFKDIASNDWYKDTVSTGAYYGLISGYKDQSFKPNKAITRQEMAVIIQKAIALTGKDYQNYDLDRTLKIFNDQPSMSDWSKKAISTMVKTGIAKGRNENEFAPQASATRAETSIMIYRLLNFLEFID
ncbi:S8 family serine peptidase [Marinisporobacter balticus]|uniref:S-layer family protein n=1 Tax=Marinisporobacter balticus TaxID=2018667 RepID=A0A4R2L109_9FIRM|nr:S8 family serine peptidase [Marinisporobacter balticus]TCO77489.1 S-layer family protein [Marinisporobacter balticus]